MQLCKRLHLGFNVLGVCKSLVFAELLLGFTHYVALLLKSDTSLVGRQVTTWEDWLI